MIMVVPPMLILSGYLVRMADFPGSFFPEIGTMATALAFKPALTMAKVQPPNHNNNINPAKVFMNLPPPSQPANPYSMSP